jgi:hypothetical protein
MAEPAPIAEEAYIYAFPMMGAYKTIYEANIDTKSPRYNGPFNKISHQTRVIDTGVGRDNIYSTAQLDLRADPMVICVPAVDKDRYYAVQLIDLYTCRYGYIGSRATGSEAGCYAIVGPSWGGGTPKGVSKVLSQARHPGAAETAWPARTPGTDPAASVGETLTVFVSTEPAGQQICRVLHVFPGKTRRCRGNQGCRSGAVASHIVTWAVP